MAVIAFADISSVVPRNREVFAKVIINFSCIFHEFGFVGEKREDRRFVGGEARVKF